MIIMGETTANVYGFMGSGKVPRRQGRLLQDVVTEPHPQPPISEEIMVELRSGRTCDDGPEAHPSTSPCSSFLYMAMDQFVNQVAGLPCSAAKASLPNGVPLGHVLRPPCWLRIIRTDRPYPMFMNVPGLKIMVPATPSRRQGPAAHGGGHG